jgi:integrase
MSVNWDARNNRWRWQFKATVGGVRYRLSRLLPRGWGETQARRFDQQETARTYARLSAGAKATVPLIEQAVALYLLERIPKQSDGKNAAQNLAHLAPFYLGRGLDDLGKVAREYADGNPLAPATIRQRLATLRAAAVHALKYHDIGSRDWIEAMPMPSVDNARHVYLTRAQVLQLARACHDPATRAWILLIFATGSRPGELFRAQPAGDHFLLPAAKNGDRTTLPVPPRFRRYIRHWPMPHDYSWHSGLFREARRSVGLDHVWPHDLRHSTASALPARPVL